MEQKRQIEAQALAEVAQEIPDFVEKKKKSTKFSLSTA